MLVLFVLLRSYNASGEYGSTGKRIDNEVFASIRDEIGNKKDPELAVDGEVFWTPTGTIWHLCSDCSFIKDSKTVLHGTVDEAKTAGMEKGCSRCYADDETDSLPQDEIEEGDVFWTPSGGVWHLSQDCRYIKNSSNVCYGNVEEAKNAGKTGVCSSCGKE